MREAEAGQTSAESYKDIITLCAISVISNMLDAGLLIGLAAAHLSRTSWLPRMSTIAGRLSLLLWRRSAPLCGGLRRGGSLLSLLLGGGLRCGRSLLSLLLGGGLRFGGSLLSLLLGGRLAMV